MKSVEFEVVAREKTGTAECRRLRKAGLVPGNLYGHGDAPLAFAVGADRIRTLFTEGSRLVDFKMANGASEKAMVREVQWDSFVKNVLHIDLLRVDASQRLNIEIKLEVRGVSPGVVAGGKLVQSLRRLAIECGALEIPEALKISVNDMNLGDTITVADLELPDGVTVETAPETLVLSCVAPTDAEEEETTDEIGPAEPEVIGKGGSDEEGDS